MIVLETERLILRHLARDEDAPFVLELVNDPSWLRFIGDRGVRTLDDARAYVDEGPAASYARHGFGLWAVVVRATGQPAGICGLLSRAGLDDVDVGFAFLPRHRGRGYAREAARAAVEIGRTRFGLRRIVAVTKPDNVASIGVLESIGMRFERSVTLAGDPLSLYAIAFPEADG